MSAIVAHFDIPYSRCLDPNGKVVGPLPEFAGDAEYLNWLYRALVRARSFDAKAWRTRRRIDFIFAQPNPSNLQSPSR